MPHRVWAIILLGVGVGIFAMARQIATWKTRTWAKFYAQHPGAAEKNPLSKHARKGSSMISKSQGTNLGISNLGDVHDK
jgi:hypothetical protein